MNMPLDLGLTWVSRDGIATFRYRAPRHLVSSDRAVAGITSNRR
jgi:hypothetical protein